MIIEIRLWAEANPGTSNLAMAASFIINSNSLFIYYPTIQCYFWDTESLVNKPQINKYMNK